MKYLMWLMLLAATPLQAQAPGDTGDLPPVQMQRLRQMVIERWRARVRTDLNLTDEQAMKLHATEDRFAARRREIAQRQAQVLFALRSELQPGVAANSDSVRSLMDERERNRSALAGLERDEDSEIAGYLSPVQHARYQLLRQQLQDRITELRRERRQRMWRGRAGP